MRQLYVLFNIVVGNTSGLISVAVSISKLFCLIMITRIINLGKILRIIKIRIKLRIIKNNKR